MEGIVNFLEGRASGRRQENHIAKARSQLDYRPHIKIEEGIPIFNWFRQSQS
jgi:hypothetical protein